MRKMKLLLSALYLTTSCVVTNYASEAYAYSDSTNIGKIELQGIDGGSYDITAQSDTVNIVFFSTTWCCHCPYVGSTLSNLAKKVNGQKVRFFYVLIGHESDDQVKAHFKNTNSNIVICKSISSLKLGNQINSVPCCIVFNKHGKIAFRYDGKRNYDSEDFKQFLIGLAKANPHYSKACNSVANYYRMPNKVVGKVRKNDKIRRNSTRSKRSALSKKSKTSYCKNITKKRSRS